MVLALIDADILAYRFAATGEEDPFSEVADAFSYGLKNVLFNVKAEGSVLYLTGKGNFREEVATVREYKGHRKDQPKPKWLKDIRQHMVDEYDAQVIDGMEADDALGLAQTERDGDTIICSTDKDLKMIPGKHYDLTKQVITEVDEETALLNFYHQLLTGDSTDNIVGVQGLGPKKADRIFIDNYMDPEHIIKEICEAYAACYQDKWQDIMQEMADLLWIRRYDWERFVCSYYW